jgi:hypothetical protein
VYVWATQIERPVVKVPVRGFEVGKFTATLRSHELQFNPSGASGDIPGPASRTKLRTLGSLFASV